MEGYVNIMTGAYVCSRNLGRFGPAITVVPGELREIMPED